MNLDNTADTISFHSSDGMEPSESEEENVSHTIPAENQYDGKEDALHQESGVDAFGKGELPSSLTAVTAGRGGSSGGKADHTTLATHGVPRLTTTTTTTINTPYGGSHVRQYSNGILSAHGVPSSSSGMPLPSGGTRLPTGGGPSSFTGTTSSSSSYSSGSSIFPALSPYFAVLQHRERKATRRHAALEAVAHSDISHLVLPDPDNPMTIVGLPPLPRGGEPPTPTAPPLAAGGRGWNGGGRGGAGGHSPSTSSSMLPAPPLPPTTSPAPVFASQYPQDSHPVNSDALNAAERKLLTKIVVDRALMAAAAENRRYQATQVILRSSGGKLAEPYGPPLLPPGLGEGNAATGNSTTSYNSSLRPHESGLGDRASTASSTAVTGPAIGADVGSVSSPAVPAASASAPVNYALDIFHAACDGDAMMIAYNLHYGADINAVGQPNPLYYDGKPLEKRWSFYAPPLVFAAAFGRERAVRALLAWGADVHGKSSTGLEAKDYAVKRGYTTILSMLEEEERKAEARKPKIVLIRK